jgi:hypothetical protein
LRKTITQFRLRALEVRVADQDVSCAFEVVRQHRGLRALQSILQDIARRRERRLREPEAREQAIRDFRGRAQSVGVFRFHGENSTICGDRTQLHRPAIRRLCRFAANHEFCRG